MNLKIIISYYSNLSWRAFVKDMLGFKYNYKVIVYNKSKKILSLSSSEIRVLPLENIGRESETYLTHIINNYDNLTDYTLFIQDDVNNHIMDNKKFIELCQEVMDRNEKFFLFPVSWRKGLKPIIRKVHNGHIKLPICPSNDAIFKMCEHLNINLPKVYKTETCAFFICHKDMIRSRSLDFYIKLREWLLTDNRNGYVLEHSWKLVFVDDK